MVTTWPSLVDRVHVSTRLLGQVLLAVLLTVSLAFSWRDGVPTDGYVDTSGPSPSGIASKQVSADNLRLPVVAPAPAPQPLVPTAQPVELLIPSLDVHRPVEMVGTDQFGVMNLPVNAWNGGWYTGSPVPGAPGDAVIEGHAGYPGKPMMFGKLATLHRGDRIIVVLADGSRQLFLVVSIRIVPIGLAPPGMAAYTGPARLTLITCTGSFDKKSYSYSNRLLLEARYAGLA
ncbi:MAG TPA: class F sortase [Candidatus Dormibacteraeota bacterium]|jgi:LPXTG-site transpeptidase (sortase) family protein